MKIDKLTTEQEDKFPEFIKKWTDIGLSTEKANRKEAEKGIVEMYEIAGLKKPKIVWCDSPMAQGITRLVVQKLESDRELKKGFIGENKKASVGNSVWNSVGNSVWDSVGDSVRNSVWDSVRDSVWDSGYGQHDANWLAFYDFFKEVCGLDEETQKLSGLWKVSKNAGWFLPHENICWVSERQSELRRDEQGRLHSDQEMAIKYPDGWGIYALDGVRLPEELWQKIISKEMSFSEIMKIEISDQRTVALKYNPQAIINENAKLIDKDDRNNELYLIEGKEINTLTGFPKMYFLKMLCPTGRTFIEGVEPSFADKHLNATECQAELCGLTKSEYMSMTLES